VKGRKNEILTRQESRQESRHDVSYFLITANPSIGEQLSSHIAKALQADVQTKTLSKSQIDNVFEKRVKNMDVFNSKKDNNLVTL
jgi:hypothetical protein